MVGTLTNLLRKRSRRKSGYRTGRGKSFEAEKRTSSGTASRTNAEAKKSETAASTRERSTRRLALEFVPGPA